MTTREVRAGKAFGCSLAGLLIAATGGVAHAADEGVGSDALELLKHRLDEQTRRIEALKEELSRQEASLLELRRALDVSGLRGRGTPEATPAARSQPPSPPPASTPPRRVVAQSAAPEQPVGRAPEAPAESRPPEVAPIFEQPGVLTPRGKWVVEPSLQYAYSSTNRIALVGYTVIPAILIGLIDVREVKSNSFTGALTVRRGITNRFEVEAKVPYLYRFDSSVSREVFTGTAVDTVFEADGRGLGDIEFTGRYQFNDGGFDRPYYIGTLRFKTRTGKDPFEVETDRTLPGGRGTGLQKELPTGSGFYTLQPGLTVLLPSDPVVFFGGVSYQYNFKRTGVSRKIENGREFLGTLQPGNAVGFNIGMGLALNERSSFSIGYDHLSVGKFRQNGRAAPTSVRVQLGTLLLGYSYKLSDGKTLNLSIGAGLTRETPDLQLTLRVPITL